MATHVKNTGRVPKQVSIVLADGTKTCIRVMPRTRKGVTLPEGSKIDGNWMALEGQGIILWEDKTVDTTPTSTATASTDTDAKTAEPVVAKKTEAATPKTDADTSATSETAPASAADTAKSADTKTENA
jgi:hypothetical protein